MCYKYAKFRTSLKYVFYIVLIVVLVFTFISPLTHSLVVDYLNLFCEMLFPSSEKEFIFIVGFFLFLVSTQMVSKESSTGIHTSCSIYREETSLLCLIMAQLSESIKDHRVRSTQHPVNCMYNRSHDFPLPINKMKQLGSL